jgi:hypothetical protein
MMMILVHLIINDADIVEYLLIVVVGHDYYVVANYLY